ncbi:uncharacterized protein LOC141623639 [Silene latifolia]|uniref:uncharacterized protein LOC141623639 n=1 Tax=Silene latifolia TaxID=37657 RepID=UPI003D76E63C
MARNARTGRGRNARQPQQEAQPAITLPDYPSIAFGSEEHQDKFEVLATRRMAPTKCTSVSTLEALGIEKEVHNIFTVLGLEGLYNLEEISYHNLTLEFLSSFTYDKETHNVSFRLNNTPFNLGSDAFADHLWVGKRVVGHHDKVEKDMKASKYYHLYTSKEKVSVSNMKTSDIEHSVLKIFLRSLTNLLYGRKDPSKLNSTEVLILSSYLNPRHESRFHFNVVSLVCLALGRMTESDQCSLDCGALVTRLAKNLLAYEPGAVDAPMSKKVVYFDLDWLRAQSWIVDGEEDDIYSWRVDDEWYMKLPASEIYPRLPL